MKEKKEKVKIRLSVDSSMLQLLQYGETLEVIDKFLPGLAEKTRSHQTVQGFSLRRLVSYAGIPDAQERMQQIEDALGKLEIYVSPEEAGIYRADYPLTFEAAELHPSERCGEIASEGVRRDTKGKRIQAHGGALFYEDGVYYWYGENKDRTDGINRIWTWGIRAYRSEDLYNWEDIGLIIPPELENPMCGLYPERHTDRPHIVYCKKTKKYVCWIKQSGEEACFMVLQAERFMGSYKMIKEGYRPFGYSVGDFDIAVEKESGNAYLFMDANHGGIIGMKLTEDYLFAQREVSRQYEGLKPPFCREGIALFEHGGKKYMLTSGMTGYLPNKSDLAVSDSWEKPFVSIGDPHRGDESKASFNNQISQVFHVPGTECYIVLGDRWVPDFPVDRKAADIIERYVACRYDPEHFSVTEQEKRFVMSSPMLASANTSVAEYVWLPVSFEPDGRPFVAWQDSWRVKE